MGGDFVKEVNPVLQEVSIHAPAWGATGFSLTKNEMESFNPRPRMGGDEMRHLWVRKMPVSIHAPAWGATANYEQIDWLNKFQSTPPHGGRHSDVSTV